MAEGHPFGNRSRRCRHILALNISECGAKESLDCVGLDETFRILLDILGCSGNPALAGESTREMSDREYWEMRLHRRTVLTGSSALLAWPGIISAQTDSCNAFSLLVSSATLAVADAGSWALQTSPSLAQLRAQVDDAENALQAAEASATTANKRRALEALNAVATTGFFIAGLSVSATTPVGAGVLAGSILWGQGMTVVKAVNFEDPVDGLEIARDVGADRMGTVLSEFSTSSYAASGRIATVSGAMGKLLSSAGMLKSWAHLATAEARYQDAASRAGELYSWFQDMRLALEQLEDIALAEKIRADCMGWLKEDADAVVCVPPQD